MSERKYQAGFYKGRGVAGSEQQGYASEGGEQIAIDIDVKVADGQVARLTTVLPFSGKATPISIDRLKALGWDGSNELRGIDQNEVDVELKYETYQGKENLKVEIKTNGGGRFQFKAPMNDQQKRGFMANLSKQAAQLASGQPLQQPPQGGGQGYPANWDQNGPPNQGGGQQPPAGQQPYKL